MIINFIGDIHIGKRPAHSTNQGAARQREKVDEAVRKGAMKEPDVIVQLGDLFDASTVTDDEFVRAYRLAKGTVLLRGNHDYNHNTYKTDALSNLLAQRNEECKNKTEVLVLGSGVYLHLVPYMPTQELFLKELDALEPSLGYVNILCLHTNMHAEGFSCSEVENNLTEERAKHLGKKFGLIVSGHEHNKALKAGCVHMVGSVFPFTFGEMEDKSVLSYNTESGTTSQIPTWSQEQGYCAMEVQEFLTCASVPDFVEIVGEMQPSEVLEVAKKTSLLFAESEVISIKNSTTKPLVEGLSQDKEVDNWQEEADSLLTLEQSAVLKRIVKETER